MVPPMPGSALWGWAGPLLVTALGAFRFGLQLGQPRAVLFDETDDVPDAYGILKHGVEIDHVSNVNALLARGSTQILEGTKGEYVVHPPLGKMLIAAGEWLFGLTPFGWRFAVAAAGSLAILMTARIARRMTRLTLLGCAAGLLLALDGLEFVLSRTAILDIFVMFWVLAAFGLLLIDRDRTRAALAAAAGQGGADGPRLGFRWPLLLAGLCLGCACATKWNGVWYVIAFAALVVSWDVGARRAAGFGTGWRGMLRNDAPWLPVWFARRAGRRLPRVVDRLVRHQLRLRPQRHGPQRRPPGRHPRRLAPVQQVDARVRPGLASRAVLPGQPAGLAGADQADRLLLLVPAGQGMRQGRLVHRAGGAGDRHAADLVGRGGRDGGLPGVVADPSRLARRCGAARRRGGWGPWLLFDGTTSDRVLLLRRGVRPVPRHRDHALPRA